MWKDLHKSRFESYATEIGFVLAEITCAVKHLGQWMKRRRKPTPLFLFPSKSYILHEPYGVALIVSPWNYPFQLLATPLVSAVAAGNCAVVKPSSLAQNTNEILAKIISNAFAPEHVAIAAADNSETEHYLAERFDYIFYTGSVEYGKHVMAAAARNLTPVTLELGGKSPCIVDRDAETAAAARRIVWGKFTNCGQTCIAPDYILAHRDIKQELIRKLKEEIARQFGPDPKQSPDYPRVVNEAHFARLVSLLGDGNIVAGGDHDESDLYIAPTLLENTAPESRVMQEEIFGPLLPILEFTDTTEAIRFVNGREKPLALYYFSGNKQKARDVLASTSSGGACINDVMVHFANTRLPFGGAGNSGTGNYHGRYGFETFSHVRAVMRTPVWPDINLKFAPYGNKLKWVKRFLK